MSFEALINNIENEKEMIRELYVFSNHFNMINNLESNRNIIIENEEKKLLKDALDSLIVQLKIINDSIPALVENIGFFKELGYKYERPLAKENKDLIVMKYEPEKGKGKVSITINKADRDVFLQNLSKSNLSINKLKKKYSIEKAPVTEFGRANQYARFANKYFRNLSDKFVQKGHLRSLDYDLRKINSPYVVRTYLSMIFLSMSIAAIFAFLLLIVLIFFKIGIDFPFFTSAGESAFLRFVKFFWIIFVIPLITGVIIYMYPGSERKNIGNRINQELPFVTIHISAIATSGIEPLTVFKIISKSDEYKYTRPEIIKLLNLVNFHGYDLVTALKKSSKITPSLKLAALFDGFAVAISSGGDLNQFLEKRAESLLFDYKLEREKYTKTSETFLDIYISIAIAAPMIMLILFVILATTSISIMGLSINALTILMLLGVVLLNLGFLVFLKLKQPLF